MLKAPGTQRLIHGFFILMFIEPQGASHGELNQRSPPFNDKVLSNFDFNLNLRRFMMDTDSVDLWQGLTLVHIPTQPQRFLSLTD